MLTLQQLAELVGGQVEGDAAQEILRVAPIDQAEEGEITFLSNPQYLPMLAETRASAVIVAPGVDAAGRTLLVCANPYLAFAKILNRLHQPQPVVRGILPGAQVAETVQYGEDVTIHPGCVVGEKVTIGRGTVLYPGVIVYDNVRIGEDCILHAGAIVREECQLGDRVILQPAAVIGSDGFGFAPDGSGYYKIPQVGIVVLEDDVEVGACSCVDRAVMGETRVCRGVKLDNLVQIGHNVTIGEDTVMAGQVGISGSTSIGRHCTFGGQTGTAGHIEIGDNITLAGGGGIASNIAGGEQSRVLSGTPAFDHKEWLKATMVFPKLPEIRREMRQLRKQVEKLKSQIKES